MDDNLRQVLNNEGIPCYTSMDNLGKYDFISMFHVLAHIDEPIGLLRNMSKHLLDDGMIYIETSNANDVLLTLYSKDCFKVCGNSKTDIRYVVSYQRAEPFFQVPPSVCIITPVLGMSSITATGSPSRPIIRKAVLQNRFPAENGSAPSPAGGQSISL